MKLVIACVVSVFFIGCGSAEKSENKTAEPAATKSSSSGKSVNVSVGESDDTMSTKTVTKTKSKCKYDTDCIATNPCVGGKCKLTGKECRFRADCPAPRGTCVSNVCEYQ